MTNDWKVLNKSVEFWVQVTSHPGTQKSVTKAYVPLSLTKLASKILEGVPFHPQDPQGGHPCTPSPGSCLLPCAIAVLCGQDQKRGQLLPECSRMIAIEAPHRKRRIAWRRKTKQEGTLVLARMEAAGLGVEDYTV